MTANVPLYQAVSAALRDVYAEHSDAHLLDIGVGDGLALLPALTPNIHRVDLVEPSAALLVGVGEALETRGIPYHAFNGTIQAFAKGHSGPWDLAQATFSLHSLAPAERRATLVAVPDHLGLVFDVRLQGDRETVFLRFPRHVQPHE